MQIKTPYEPTFFPGHPRAKPSVIDMILTKNYYDVSNPISLNKLSSNHNPIISSLGGTVKQAETEPKFNYHQANWKKYQQYIQDELKIPTTLQNPIYIDSFIRHLTYTILSAAEKSIPLITGKDVKPSISSSTLKIIEIKNYYRKILPEVPQRKYI